MGDSWRGSVLRHYPHKREVLVELINQNTGSVRYHKVLVKKIKHWDKYFKYPKKLVFIIFDGKTYRVKKIKTMTKKAWRKYFQELNQQLLELGIMGDK
jgi:hypothetical protein